MLDERIEFIKKPTIKEKRLLYSRISMLFSIMYLTLFNLIAVIIGLLLTLLLGLLSITIDLKSDDPLAIYFILTVNLIAIIIIGLTTLSVNRKLPFLKTQKTIKLIRNDWKVIGIAFSIIMVLVGSYQLFVSYLQNNVISDGNIDNPYDFFNTDKIGIIIFATFIVTFIAPIAEEFFYRWTLITTLRNGLNKNATILFSALIFSFAHSFTDLSFSFSYFLIHLIAVFLIGIILGYVFYQTENILVTIILHGLWNLLITTSAFFEFGGYGFIFTIFFSILIALCAIFLIYNFIIHLTKKTKMNEFSADFKIDQKSEYELSIVNNKIDTQKKPKIKLHWAWFELVLGYFILAGIIPLILRYISFGDFFGEGIIEYFYLVLLAIIGAILLLFFLKKINIQSKEENEFKL